MGRWLDREKKKIVFSTIITFNIKKRCNVENFKLRKNNGRLETWISFRFVGIYRWRRRCCVYFWQKVQRDGRGARGVVLRSDRLSPFGQTLLTNLTPSRVIKFNYVSSRKDYFHLRSFFRISCKTETWNIFETIQLLTVSNTKLNGLSLRWEIKKFFKFSILTISLLQCIFYWINYRLWIEREKEESSLLSCNIL